MEKNLDNTMKQWFDYYKESNKEVSKTNWNMFVDNWLQKTMAIIDQFFTQDYLRKEYMTFDNYLKTLMDEETSFKKRDNGYVGH